MRQALLLSLLLPTLLLGSRASADTMYKCVDPNGKIAYANVPCVGNSNVAKTFTVSKALDDNALSQAEADRKARLKKVNDAIEKHAADRERQDNPVDENEEMLRKAGLYPSRDQEARQRREDAERQRQYQARLKAAQCARRDTRC